ncbi:hypothetical protein [Rufibacter sp. XAAS-G3-1]|uniref:hypothetical protein n=1 Tax=Rufibacter sp. XAAS-G3-1 TaxID=2729134 RepID=UPI0015E6F87F|nr:hypothetical protein [Rufibacter sp. XAAS-G3-1]
MDRKLEVNQVRFGTVFWKIALKRNRSSGVLLRKKPAGEFYSPFLPVAPGGVELRSRQVRE